MTTDLREGYIAALIATVEEGNLLPDILDRIERLLADEAITVYRVMEPLPEEARRQLIEPQAPEVDPPVDNATPAPAHEDAQETGPTAESECTSPPPAPSPEPRRSPLIGLQPTVKHEDPEQATEAKPTPRAEEEALASDPPAPASPAPMAAPNGDTKDAQLARAGESGSRPPVAGTAAMTAGSMSTKLMPSTSRQARNGARVTSAKAKAVGLSVVPAILTWLRKRADEHSPVVRVV